MASEHDISEDLLAQAYGASGGRYGALKQAVASRLARTSTEAASGREDRYDIQSEIARGGVGIVYRAYDRQLQRSVALKKLNPDYVDHPEMVERFVEEAQVGGQLQHPGVVPVHEVGRDEHGHPFFAMKLVKGRTLAELLEHDATTRAELIRVFERICQTIAYAHDRGIVHRDLKPANIMVGAFGEVQVMDWGLAKVIARPDASDVIETVRTAPTASLSRVGSVMGTPAYMPPEQAQGRIQDVDERSDVFALGAILCEVLTGAPPYVAGSHASVMELAVEADTSDARRRLAASAADPSLKDLASSCLEPAPASRPTAGAAVADRVSTYLASVEERAQTARVQAARAKARTVAALIALVALIAGGIAYAVWESDRRERTRVLREQIASARTETNRKAEDADRADRRDPSAWTAVEAIAERAVIMANDDLLPVGERRDVAAWRRTITERAQAARDEAARLARDESMTRILEGHRQNQVASAAFERIFKEYGIDLAKPPAHNAAIIAASSIPRALIDGLDFWLLGDPDRRLRPANWQAIKAILDLADGDPVRTDLRNTLISNDVSAVKNIADRLARESDNLQGVILAAQYLRRNALVDRSLELLHGAYPNYTDDFTLLLEIVKSYWVAGKPEQALGYVRALHAARPQLGYVWEIESTTYSKMLDMPNSIRAANRALALAPDSSSSAHHSLYVAALKRGDRAAAIHHLEKALKANAYRFYWWQLLGLMYLHDRAFDKAIEAYERALEHKPRYVECRYELGVALQSTGRLDEALQAFSQTITDGLAEAKLPGHASWHAKAYDVGQYVYQARMNIGRIQYERQAYRKAAAAFAPTLAMKQREPIAFEYAANALAAAGESAQARRVLEQGIDAFEDDAGLLYNLAVLSYKLGYEEQALAAANASIEQKRRPEPLGVMADIHIARCDLPAARALLERAQELGLSPNAAKRRYRQRDQLIKNLARMRREGRSDDRPAALMLFGDICSRRGEHDAAVDFFARALTRLGDSAAEPDFDQAMTAAIVAARAVRATAPGPKRTEYVEALVDWLDGAIDTITEREANDRVPRAVAARLLGFLRHHRAFVRWLEGEDETFSKDERAEGARLRKRLDQAIVTALDE